MTQWVIVFAAKPYDMSSVPGTYMVEEEKKKKHCMFFFVLHIYSAANIITHM
jgi:hypothetical protein